MIKYFLIGISALLLVTDSEAAQEKTVMERIRERLADDIKIAQEQSIRIAEIEAEIDRIQSELEALDIKRDKCPVCLESFYELKDLALTKCDHIFCMKCIQQLAGEECPICRQKFEKKDVINFKYSPGEESEIELLAKDRADPAENGILLEENDPRVTPAFAAFGRMQQVGTLIWSGVVTRTVRETRRNWSTLFHQVITERQVINRMSQGDAQQFCQDLGGGARLPTREEYQILASTRIQAGSGYDRDLHPEMASNWFWSGSEYGIEGAYYFDGFNGQIGHDFRVNHKALRCVVDCAAL